MFCWFILLCFLQGVSGGLLVRRIDVCVECVREADTVSCQMSVPEPVLLRITCPVNTLMVGPGIKVAGLKAVSADVRAVVLERTLLTCKELHGIVATLNGTPCPATTINTTSSTLTTTTTTKNRWVPWPLMPEDDHNMPNNTSANSTTTPAQTSAIVSSTDSTHAVETSTVTIAISTAWRFNNTTIIVTVAVLFACVGTFISFRCVWRRRRRNNQPPVQVAEVSSSSFINLPISPRRRRRTSGADSYENVELFSVDKRD